GGRLGVDGADAGMRMGGAHDGHVRLAGQIDVVVVAAFAAEETDVLEAAYRLPDPELAHPEPATTPREAAAASREASCPAPGRAPRRAPSSASAGPAPCGARRRPGRPS